MRTNIRFICYLIEGAFEAARELAEDLGARFIDARVTPFKLCDWCQLLEFMSAEGCELVM